MQSRRLRVKARGGHLRGGFEQELDGGWSMTAGVGVEDLSSVLVDGMRSRSTGRGFSAGVGVRRRADAKEAAFSLSGGRQQMRTARSVDLFSPLRGQAEPESGYLRSDARFAYVMENGRLFVRPALNVWAAGLLQHGFAEKGPDGLGARGAGHVQWLGGASPELTFGVIAKETPASQAAVSFTLGGP